MAIASGSMRRTAPALVTQRSQAVRLNLFVLVRILFQYLERVDRSILDLAKEVLKDCERKHNTKDSKYETLADAIGERVRDAVGENHWTKAREIQKQLAANQQKKKIRAMQLQQKRRSHILKEKNGKMMSTTKQQHQQQQQQQQQQQTTLEQRTQGNPSCAAQTQDNEAMDVAMTLSGMSSRSPSASGVSPAPSTNSSNLYSASQTVDRQEGIETSNNYQARRPEPGKLNLTIKEAEPSTSAPSSTRGQLPLRKRIMFASPPASNATAPSSASNSDSSFSFTMMRK